MIIEKVKLFRRVNFPWLILNHLITNLLNGVDFSIFNCVFSSKFMPERFVIIKLLRTLLGPAFTWPPLVATWESGLVALFI